VPNSEKLGRSAVGRRDVTDIDAVDSYVAVAVVVDAPPGPMEVATFAASRATQLLVVRP
jgi:hypothetical protein